MTKPQEARAAALMDDAYLPLNGLATYSGLSVRTLRGYLTRPSHPLPHFRPEGKILEKRSEFDEWMAQFRVAAVDRVDSMVAEMLRGL
jgi:hypothetical protein